ncbi:antiterminator Q family protein [Actinobacillus equuli]|uniref:antiterminator Q family protein n=1 Tax=Actinobacillus equuli TaxID=718 RepID=UPI003C6EA7B3
MCYDDVGMLMKQIISYYINNPNPQAYKYLKSKYVYGLSVRQIAKHVERLHCR